MKKQLVRLRARPSRDGSSFTYFIDYVDENNKRRQISLGHADRKKAERQQAQKERELRMGIVEPESMRLSKLLEDILERSRGQVRDNTLIEYESTMKSFIKVTSNIDCRSVNHKHGERFIQACLDGGNRPATVGKKLGTMKRLFQLAVERGQLDENPLRFVRKPKVTRRAIKVYSNEQISMMLKVACESQIGLPFRWDILMLTAFSTAMRRGELLNTTWHDIDFESGKINISPKQDTEDTWQWEIKDDERRSVPITDDIVNLLAEHQTKQPEGYPYVFIPPKRYDYIQQLRSQGNWTQRDGNCPVSNFRRQFQLILSRAGIESGKFHDIRRTCITNWFAQGLSEYEVMVMAGHSSFETTRRFYLAVRKDLITRAKEASTKALFEISVAHLLRTPVKGKK